MKEHTVRTATATHPVPREQELLWRLAHAAVHAGPVTDEVRELVIDRIIDAVGVGIAAVNTDPAARARAQALAHPRPGGAALLGVDPSTTVHAEWAAYSNETTIRHLDWTDTFGAAEEAHPSDSIAAVVATAQQCARSGADVLRGVASAYQTQIALATGVGLHDHGMDQLGHLGTAIPAGIAALLGLPAETAYQAVQLGTYLATGTRQVRVGEISSWKANGPGFVGKTGIEAVDRALRGELAPTPVYEGAAGEMAVLLGGPDATVTVPVLEPGESPELITQSFPKQWAAQYEANAIIDLALRVRRRIPDLGRIRSVVLTGTEHMNDLIGSGDPTKFDPDASRGTLDHSAPYIMAVALQDGDWDWESSYTSERAHRPETVALWDKVRTRASADWTAAFHADRPEDRRTGCAVDITLDDGTVISDRQDNPNSSNHPVPWGRDDYVAKFRTITANHLDDDERERFLSRIQRLPDLRAAELRSIYPVLRAVPLADGGQGLF